MAITPYLSEVISDDGNTYNSIPSTVSLPEEDYKYFSMTFLRHYNIRYIADVVYGDASLWWLITKSNKIIDSFSFSRGDKVRILKPEYLNEVVIENG